MDEREGCIERFVLVEFDLESLYIGQLGGRAIIVIDRAPL